MSQISLKIGEVISEPGTKKFGRINLVKTLDGGEAFIPVHIVHGKKQGPILLLDSTQHGDEDFTITIVRKIVQKTDVNRLAGTIIAIPVVNPYALATRTRVMFSLGAYAAYNLDRMYFLPGKNLSTFHVYHKVAPSLPERIAYEVAQILEKAKVVCVLDLHSGPYALGCEYNYLGATAPANVETKIRELCKVLGQEFIIHDPLFPFEGMLVNYAAKLNIPGVQILYGAQMHGCEEYLERGVRGVENVMKHLGMISGKPILPKKQFVVRERIIMKATHGGMFFPKVGGIVEALHKRVPEGTVLGTIISPYTFEELERVTAPYEETALLLVRARSTVNPGEYLYTCADMKTAEVIENE